MMHSASRRHLAGARTIAGLTQVQLAQLAGVHVNGIKRLERMNSGLGGMTLDRVAEALHRRGILVDRWPTPFVRLAG
jgi:transcriptional regulator with XRE-family HTH domain